MPDTKISALTALSAAPATGDLLPIVDVSDTSMAASGTTKYITIANVLTTPTVNGLLTVTQGTANAGVMASTGYSLTGSNATNMIDLAGTWNTSGTPTAIKVNITDTASNAASLLMDLQVGSASKFSVSKGGVTTALSLIAGSGGTDGMYIEGAANRARMHLSFKLGWTADTYAGTLDTILERDAAATLALKNAANAQTFRIYGNTTGSHYLNMTHNGTNAVLSVNGGGNLHISSLPTANPGAGILWNNAGTPAIGT